MCSGKGHSFPTAITHNAHGPVHQLQYRELEKVFSGDINPQEGQSQEYNNNEKIEASTNRHSVSRMPVTQIRPAVNTPLQQAQHRVNHHLSLGLSPYPLQEGQKDCHIPFRIVSVSCSFASFPAALAHRAQSKCFPLAVLQEQSWCQCS